MMFPLGFLLAHVGRLVEIGKELRLRGHQVMFAGDWPRHERSRLDLAAKEGFPVLPMPEPDHPYAWDHFQKYGWPVTGLDLARLRRWAPLDDILEAQVELVRREKPDMLLCDASISTSTTSYITGVPATGVLNAYGLQLISPGSIFYPMIKAWDWARLSRMRKRVYDRYEVTPRNALELLREMPLLSPDLEGLYKTPSEFWPNYHTVGPIVSEPCCELPPWYDDLDDGTINVYITMGSTGFLEGFLRQAYDALGKTPYRFIVTTAGQVSEDTVRQAPDNFLLAKYAPGSKILEKCRAMIYHGGNGSMYQALAAGIPMIALPSHLEQEICADLAIRHGYGLKLPARKVRGKRLVAMLERLLNEPGFAQAARRLSARVREADGAVASADFVEKIARRHARSTRFLARP